ncbi:uncharacterized protein LOC112505962 [Cynara cardunculus var. scolymus]|uniref:uncharacterized protein LOC112505962 n=1 Tax=Cynara cardunculus var. scolymus TaxID=59895 RepID=UPI000D631091|nr:uncharacterized protein LOC112505962 [Cynara cardunculus var. scolymus]
MSGKFNGLKALILSDNNSTFYIHCFAHQLQLVVVAVAKKHEDIKDFFDLLASVVTVVNSSCKRKDMLRESHKERIQEEIGNNEIETDKGLNQEISLVRAGDTRWNPHLKTIVSLMALFPEFNKSSLLKLSQMYPRDFEDKERIILEHELDIYNHSVYNNVRFANLNGIADLARLMVATRKHLSHPLVYRLLKLTLVLPVATAMVERCFSTI